MKSKFYAVFTESGFDRVTKKRPDIAGGEIAILINIEIPVSFFRRYTPTVDIIMPEIVGPTEMDLHVEVEAVEAI